MKRADSLTEVLVTSDGQGILGRDSQGGPEESPSLPAQIKKPKPASSLRFIEKDSESVSSAKTTSFSEGRPVAKHGSEDSLQSFEAMAKRMDSVTMSKRVDSVTSTRQPAKHSILKKSALHDSHASSGGEGMLEIKDLSNVDDNDICM